MNNTGIDFKWLGLKINNNIKTWLVYMIFIHLQLIKNSSYIPANTKVLITVEYTKTNKAYPVVKLVCMTVV